MHHIHRLVLVAAISSASSGSDVIKNLNKCLTDIIDRYFHRQFIRVYAVGDLCPARNKTTTTPPLPSDCFDFTAFSQVTIELVDADFEPAGRVLNTFILVSDDGLDYVSSTIRRLKMTSYWNTKLLIVLVVEGADAMVEGIFREVWTKTRLINSVVVTATESAFLFHTWYPYERGKCGVTEGNVREAERWTSSSGFETTEWLYPEKKIATGLNGCAVNVTTAKSDFFTLFKDVPNEESDGLDLKIVFELSRKYEVDFRYVFPPPGESHWFRTYKNGSLQGTMRMLFEYETDVGFSGLRINLRVFPYISISCVYFIDPVKWFVPKASLDLGWRSIFNIFSPDLWLAVLASLFVCTTVVYALHKIGRRVGRIRTFPRSYSYCFMEVFGMTLTHPALFVPRSFIVRSFLFCYMVYSLNITTSYQSVLIGILTAPSNLSPYRSLRAAFERGLNMYFLPYDSAYYRNDSLGEVIIRSKQYREVSNVNAVMMEIVFNKTAALLIGNSRIMYSLSTSLHDKRGRPLVDFIPGTISINLIVFHLSPNNPLKDLFDEVILRLLQAGLINKWKMDLWKPKGISEPEEEAIKRLTLGHLKNVFGLHCFFLGFAFLIFLCEMTCCRPRTKKANCRKRHVIK